MRWVEMIDDKDEVILSNKNQKDSNLTFKDYYFLSFFSPIKFKKSWETILHRPSKLQKKKKDFREK